MVAVDAEADELVWNLVDKYGMNASNAKPAVDAAVADALNYLGSHSGEDVVLYFPPGEWTFLHDGKIAIYIKDKTSSGRLIFRGAGQDSTTLLFDDFKKDGIRFESAANLTVEKLHLSRPGIYVTQGDVVSVSPGKVRLKVHDGFPDMYGLIMDPKSQTRQITIMRFRGTLLDPQNDPNSNKILVDRCEVLGRGVYDIILEDKYQVANYHVGDWVAVKAKVGGGTMWTNRVTNLTVQDILFTRGSGPAWWARGFEASDNNGIIARRITIDRPDEPINGRVPFYSIPSDGIHIFSGTGGTLIQDCLIIGAADDAIAYNSSDGYNLDSGTIIENNTIIDGHGCGIWIAESRNGICRNNTIVRRRGPSILLARSKYSPGIATAALTNWEISNNTLIQSWTEPVISFEAFGSDRNFTNNNVNITGNTFIDAPKSTNLVSVKYSNEVCIDNNVIVSFSPEDDWPSNNNDLVYVISGKSVQGTGNIMYEASARAVWNKIRPGDNVDVTWTFDDSGHFIQAEDFDEGGQNVGYYDITPGNTGGEYRIGEDVDIQACSQGGYNVGWIDAGEWMEYTITVAGSGDFKFEFRVSSDSSKIQFNLEKGDITLATVDIPATGNSNVYKTVERTVSLLAGEQTLRVAATGGGWNIDWLHITPYTVVYDFENGFGQGVSFSGRRWTIVMLMPCFAMAAEAQTAAAHSAGRNKLRVAVTNTLVNRFGVGRPGKSADRTSGLLGPVVITAASIFAQDAQLPDLL